MNKLQIGKMPQLPFEVSEAINQLRINLSCFSQIISRNITLYLFINKYLPIQSKAKL